MNNKEKSTFRKTKKWNDFRDQEIKKRGLKCELFGSKLRQKTAQFHHLDPEHYDDLTPDKFKLLSPTAHTMVEFLALLIHGNTTTVPRLELLLAWIGPFLPKPEQGVKKFYAMIKEDVAKKRQML